MDSKPNWPNRQLADGYNFVDAASTGFDGAVLMIPSSLTGFNQTAFGYVQDPNGGTTMCFGGILTSYGNAPCCPECGRRMHINGTVTGEIKHVPFGNIPVSIGTCLISPVTVPLICMRLPHSGQHGALLQLVRIPPKHIVVPPSGP